jgi:hypothetical protein
VWPKAFIYIMRKSTLGEVMTNLKLVPIFTKCLIADIWLLRRKSAFYFDIRFINIIKIQISDIYFQNQFWTSLLKNEINWTLRTYKIDHKTKILRVRWGCESSNQYYEFVPTKKLFKWLKQCIGINDRRHHVPPFVLYRTCTADGQTESSLIWNLSLLTYN